MMKKRFFSLIFITLSLGSLLCAMARKQKAPLWLTMPGEVYPSSKYFAGTGYGPNRETAALEAVRSVASIFGQNVLSDSTASKKMARLKKKGKLHLLL